MISEPFYSGRNHIVFDCSMKVGRLRFNQHNLNAFYVHYQLLSCTYFNFIPTPGNNCSHPHFIGQETEEAFTQSKLAWLIIANHCIH